MAWEHLKNNVNREIIVKDLKQVVFLKFNIPAMQIKTLVKLEMHDNESDLDLNGKINKINKDNISHCLSDSQISDSSEESNYMIKPKKSNNTKIRRVHSN